MSERSSAIVFPGLLNQDKLKLLSPIRQAEHEKVSRLISEACRLYGITLKEINSHKRARNIVEPRSICMYILVNDMGYGGRVVGKEIFKGFDHTTVFHSRNTVRNLIYSDERVRAITDYLLKFVGL